MADERTDADRRIERMRENTAKANRPTRARPDKRARKMVPKPGRKKA